MTLVSALIDASIPGYPPLDPVEAALVRQRVRTSAETQIRAAPLHVRMALRTMLASFLLFVLIAKRRSVEGLTPGARSAILSQFSRVMPPVFSAMERLIRSATLLAYYEDPAVLAALGYEPLGLRRDRRRIERLARR